MSQKWNLQDIRPAGSSKQTTREIPMRKSHQDISYRTPKKQPVETVIDSDISTIDIIDGNSLKRRRVMTTTIVATIIVVLGFLVNIFLGGAEVTVYPKVKDLSVQASFTAYTQPQTDDLGYELLKLEAVGEKQVQAKGKETVSQKAEGKIFIYNTKSTAPQRLIKNTRFESKDGLIFRIKESVEVPGVTKGPKGESVPGSVVADVFADGTGEQYNLEPGRFSVPGLKGSDQFDSVYAENTSPFTGGFEGEKYLIDDQELNTAHQALQIELRDKLLGELQSQRPAGFVIFNESITFTFDSLPSTEYGDSLATIKLKARLQVPMFKESEFSEFIAKKSVPDYKDDPVTITNPESFAFSYTSATTTITDIAEYSSIEFILNGTAKIVWKFDEEKLKEELLNIKKTSATQIFSSYNSISHAQAVVRPFWRTTFPNTPNEIEITTIIDESKP